MPRLLQSKGRRGQMPMALMKGVNGGCLLARNNWALPGSQKPLFHISGGNVLKVRLLFLLLNCAAFTGQLAHDGRLRVVGTHVRTSCHGVQTMLAITG